MPDDSAPPTGAVPPEQRLTARVHTLVHTLVHGFVPGVGYRDFCTRAA